MGEGRSRRVAGRETALVSDLKLAAMLYVILKGVEMKGWRRKVKCPRSIPRQAADKKKVRHWLESRKEVQV